MLLFRKIALFVALAMTFLSSFSQEEKKTAFQVNGSFGQFIPHKKSVNYLVKGKSPSLEFSIINRETDSIHYGLSASILNSGNPEVIGMIYGLNGFASFPINKKENGPRLRVGIGMGYVEHIFDANLNNQNIAIGSHFNAKIVFRTEKEFKLSANKHINLGVGICHFSNGSYQTPNLGLNFLLFNLGYSYIKTSPIKKDITKKEEPGISETKWQYSLVFSGGLRENVHPLRNKYPLFNLSNRVNYLRTNKNHFAGGLDITYNPGIKHTPDTALTISPMQSGIFLGNEIHHGKLSFTIDMGIYLYNQNMRSLLYHRFGVRYKLNKKMQVLFQLKSHWAVAETFELGLKFRIK